MKIKYQYFILGWTLLNLLQGAFTELTSDEGYYWYYTTSLEWGYYDHPPFLAWMIKAGYTLFPNELGVRLLNILVNSASLLLFFRMSGLLKYETPVYILILATPLLNYLAFIVFPDGPLLFFSLLFLWAYKKFLQKEEFTTALIIGISIAGMLYSKYYGILIVVFTVLSNLRLLKSGYFYLAGLIAFALYIPHIYWQYNHDFQTLKYHLSGRVSGIFGKHVLEYISQQVLAIGPVLILFPFIYKTAGTFERALKFIVAGTFLFFLITSLETFVHFHWTSIAIFPLLWLSSKYFAQSDRKKLLAWLSLPFIALLLLFRVYLVWPVFGVNHVGVDYYHGREAWAQEISVLAGERPVVFVNDFRESSLYSFYAGKTGVALFTGEKRRSQYDLWNYEEGLRGKDVLLLSKSEFEGADIFQSGIGIKYYMREISNYSSYYNVPIKIRDLQRSGTDSVSLAVELFNPRDSVFSFQPDESGNYPVLYYGFKFKGNRNIEKQDSLSVMMESDHIPPGGFLIIHCMLPLPKDRDPRRISLGFQHGIIPDSYNYITDWEVK